MHAGTIVGNVYNKYDSCNPIARRLMGGFLKSVSELYREASPESVLEVGCGEGRLSQHLLETRAPARFEACDLTLDQLAPGLDPRIKFRTASIYDLPYADGEFELVACCEVLEHLTHPQRALAELTRVSGGTVLVSTPREPLWRVLNVLRGKYLGQLGNTPGHLQHFSSRDLMALAETRLEIIARRNPLPWTMLLGKVRR